MPPIRVTRITGGAVIDISRLLSVLVVHFALPVVVADEASELPEVAGRKVAGLAAIPLPAMGAGEDWEELLVVLCETRSLPRVVRMTDEAGSRESGTPMLIVIIALVAGDTIVLICRRENRPGDALVVTARAPNVRMPSE